MCLQTSRLQPEEQLSQFGAYLKLSTKETAPLAIAASNVSFGSTTMQVSALAGYSIVDQSHIRLDIVGGAQLWSVRSALSFDGSGFKDDATWSMRWAPWKAVLVSPT